MTINAVDELGLDPTGKADCAPMLRDFLNSADAANTQIYFPKGRYYFRSTVESNQKNVRMIGGGLLANMGDSPVVFCSDQYLESIIWWNGSKTNSNMNGPRIENIQLQDSSSDHAHLRSAIRLTATANMELKVGFQNLRPQRYTVGSVSVVTGSKTVTGIETKWKDYHSRCAWLVISGYLYEIDSVQSETSLTLAIAYQGTTDNSVGYAINWGGVGVWCEPGTDFTQYGKSWSLNGRCGCALFASSGSTSPKYTGTSRIKVLSGYLNGEGIPDSVACYLGPYSDTFRWDVAMNSYAFGIVIANGHQHDLQHLDLENAGGPPPVTGMPEEYSSCRGILVMSDNSSDTWGNRIGGYFRQIGTAIELYGTQGKAPTWTVVGSCTFRSNKVNLVLGNSTKTIGAEPYAQ